jgi:hypothetical protein
MDGDAFIVRTNRAVAELQASAARSESKLEQILALLQPKAPEVLPSPALQPSPPVPLPSPWDDFVT